MDGHLPPADSSPRTRRLSREAIPRHSAMNRTTSTSSSSDILVAGNTQSSSSSPYAMQQRYPPERRPARWAAARKATAPTKSGAFLSVQFVSRSARERLRSILQSPPKPLSGTFIAPSRSIVKVESVPEAEDEDEDEDDSDGPNHRGTYSKDYVLKHPDIKWIHRGQGRYLPASELKPDPVDHSPRPTRQRGERTSVSLALSEQTMESMTEALVQYFDDFRRRQNPVARENWSPTFKHQFGLILNLIKTTPRHQWSKAIEGIRDNGFREIAQQWNQAMKRRFPTSTKAHDERDVNEEQGARTRPVRQAKTALPSIEQHRRSSRLTDTATNLFYDDGDDTMDSDDSQDPDKTFRREYVEQHPGQKFYHTGNGWYKRGSRSEDRSEKRRDSNTTKRSVPQPSCELDVTQSVHGDDLHKYPGHTFHHRGNKWYRAGEAPDGRKGTCTIDADGQKISWDDHPEIAEEIKSNSQREEGHTVSKAYADLHPETEWVHRGGGRYKRKSSIFGSVVGTTTPAASSDRRSSRVDNSFSKDSVDSPVEAEIRRTSGRSRQPRHSFGDAGEDDSRRGRRNKQHLHLSPEDQADTRNQEASSQRSRPSLAGSDRSQSGKGELFDLKYVLAHDDVEIFHHRGQGRWARGLPPAGASNKMAVRGPGAKESKSDAGRTGEENEAGEKPPPLSALLKKDEGPLRWPHLNWTYRGGGKWCRQTKEESHRAANAHTGFRKIRAVASKAKQDGAEAQLQQESLAADDVIGREDVPRRRPRVSRKRSQHSVAPAADYDRSKASSNSQSKAATPRPALLAPEEDRVTDEDLPSLYKDEWSEVDEDELDEAGRIMRQEFRPIAGAGAFVKALTKHDPQIRSLDSLRKLTDHAQDALQRLQDEYLRLDEVVAAHPMNGKKERRPVKGGRQAVEHQVWEDRKEAMLYDYTFDPRRIGYQDPIAQRIIRDDEGRELRRRGRGDPHATAVNYGDGEMTSKRAVKPVSRFDGVVVQPPPRKRSRLTLNSEEHDLVADKSPSMTPDRGRSTRPTEVNADGFEVHTSGRWKGHVPKRVRELQRGDSVGSMRSNNSDNGSPKPGAGSIVRKGRPPGSKNLHRRRDAGIKKGPRKPKTTPSSSTEPEGLAEAIAKVPAIIADPLDDMPAAAAPDAPMDVDRAAGRALSLTM